MRNLGFDQVVVVSYSFRWLKSKSESISRNESPNYFVCTTVSALPFVHSETFNSTSSTF